MSTSSDVDLGVVYGQRPEHPQGDSRGRDSILGRWRLLPRLLRLMWSLGPYDVAFIGFFWLVSGVTPIAAVAVLRLVVDSSVEVAAGSAPTTQALQWVALLMLVGLVHRVLGFMNQDMGQHHHERLRARVQELLVSKASRLSLASFEQPGLYDMLHRAQDGVDNRLSITMKGIFSLPSQLITVVGLLIYLGASSPLLPLPLVAGLIPFYIVTSRYNQRLYLLRRRQTASQRRLDYLGELMTGREAAAEVRLFGLGGYLLDKRLRLFRDKRDERLKLGRGHSMAAIRSSLVEQIAYGLVIVGIVALIAGGRLSVGYFAALLAAAERFRDGVMYLVSGISTVDGDLRYLRDLLDYLDLEEESPGAGTQPPNSTGTPTLSFAQESPAIRFERASFTYPGVNTPALDGVDLDLRPGERLALVGANGSGKTTLAKLLVGLYRPTEGRIRVGGVDLADVDPSGWRLHVAAVFQDFVKYEIAARDNIGFGDLEKLDNLDAIDAAAGRSGADGVIASLSAGYETVLGRAYDEHGQDLSQGQWQRLAIARAYLRDALVLVLDEPTAALDAKAEVDVYRQFRDASQGKTVLLISHRLGSARLADRIIFLEKGRVVEEGTHADLVALEGRYAEMYSVQAGWYR